ncbi:P-selectin isoform X2 [Mustela lutreola]|uniref:P-selectin isoform X2 n=1 Tax=Mustela lutreola TaxID=9666 RepID=UPI002796F39E|nr:P-selectin isoform X2 [Mustela lutreola]
MTLNWGSYHNKRKFDSRACGHYSCTAQPGMSTSDSHMLLSPDQPRMELDTEGRQRDYKKSGLGGRPRGSPGAEEMASCLKAIWNWRFHRVVLRTAQLLWFSALIFDLIKQEEVAAWTYHYSTKAYSWNYSRVFCQKHYTDLVAIQNKKEIAHLNEVIPYSSSYYWIGIRKVGETWTWVGTKQPLTEEAANWADHEPNNKKNNQDCVEIYIKSASAPGQWNDEPCGKRKRALCYAASCQDMSCSKQGECIETIGNYTCSCFPGFYGPECEYVRECGDLDLPPQAFMNCSHPLGNFSFTSECRFHCTEGYELNGPSKLECLASGVWTSEPPQCVAAQCPPLKTPERGSMTCPHSAEAFLYGTSCHFSCEEGFALVGSEVVQCMASGVWTAAAPVCEVVQCPLLEAPGKGTMDCVHPLSAFAYGSSCKFGCEPGYQVRGWASLRCTGSGQWTAPSPACEAIACGPLQSPVHGSMDCSPSSGAFQDNTSCSFRCAEGFKLEGADLVQCTELGQWTAPAPVCQALQCQDLLAPNKGQVNCSHPLGAFRYESTCHFACSEGSHLVGASVLRCLRSGNWSSPPPECHASTCTALGSPHNGTMTCVQPLGDSSYRATCRFACDEGFSLSGPQVLDCTPSGHWTGSAPTCEAIKCPELFAPERGSLACSDTHKELGVGSTCRFSCNKGLKLEGSSHVECTASGKWTAPPPTCEGTVTARTSEAVRCPALITPEQGTMSCRHHLGNFGLNTTCYFGCKAGFTLMGDSARRCRPSGQWTGGTPACRAVRCSELRVIEPGGMNCSNPWGGFSYGSTCTFYCPEGQVLNGSARTACQENGQWSTPMPACQGPLTIQQALTYFGGAVASTIGLVTCGTLLALLRKRLRQKDDGESPLNPQSHLGTYGVFTNAAFDPSP